MLSRARIGVLVCRRALSLTLSRNVGVSAPCCQKAAAATDPIQKMFIDKIHEYSEKSKASGGKLVDASPAIEKHLADELEKVARIYGAKGDEFTKFPTFNFADPDLEPVGISAEVKLPEVVEEEALVDKEEEDDGPFWEV